MEWSSKDKALMAYILTDSGAEFLPTISLHQTLQGNLQLIGVEHVVEPITGFHDDFAIDVSIVERMEWYDLVCWESGRKFAPRCPEAVDCCAGVICLRV
jgi:hypothetical protein